MKRSNYFVIFLLLFSIGCFLPAARAEEQDKDVPPKPGQAKHGPKKHAPPTPTPQKPAPAKAATTKPGPTKPAFPVKTAQPMPGLHKTTIPHGQQGEVHHKADRREGHRGNVLHFKGSNYHHWNQNEQAIWRSGAWRHEKYMGRYGWWWMAGGMMYFYEEPVYPYPTEVPEIEYELTDDDQTSEEFAQPPGFDPNYWYYCEDPKGYYPYISECPGGWMTLVPQPEKPEQ